MPPPIYVTIGLARPFDYENGLDRWAVQWLGVLPDGTSVNPTTGIITQNIDVYTKIVPPIASGTVGNWTNFVNIQVMILNSLLISTDVSEDIWIEDKNGNECYFGSHTARNNYQVFSMDVANDVFQNMFKIDMNNTYKEFNLIRKLTDAPITTETLVHWNVTRQTPV